MKCPKCGNIIRPQDTTPAADIARCKTCGFECPFRKTFIETVPLHCPKCTELIAPDSINLETDVARCSACNEVFTVLDLVEAGEARHFSENPPPGTWFEKTSDGFRAGSSTRQRGTVFLVVFLSAVSAIALLSVFAPLLDSSFTIAFTITGIIVFVISGLFWFFAALGTWGKVVVEVHDDRGSVFVGIGPLGRKKLFDWTGVSAIRQEESKRQYPGAQDYHLVIQAGRPIVFGSMLNALRRFFMLGVLRKMLAERDAA